MFIWINYYYYYFSSVIFGWRWVLIPILPLFLLGLSCFALLKIKSGRPIHTWQGFSSIWKRGLARLPPGFMWTLRMKLNRCKCHGLTMRLIHTWMQIFTIILSKTGLGICRPSLALRHSGAGLAASFIGSCIKWSIQYFMMLRRESMMAVTFETQEEVQEEKKTARKPGVLINMFTIPFCSE